MLRAVLYQNTPGIKYPISGINENTIDTIATILAINPAYKNISLSLTAAEAKSITSRG